MVIVTVWGLCKESEFSVLGYGLCSDFLISQPTHALFYSSIFDHSNHNPPLDILFTLLRLTHIIHYYVSSTAACLTTVLPLGFIIGSGGVLPSLLPFLYYIPFSCIYHVFFVRKHVWNTRCLWLLINVCESEQIRPSLMLFLDWLSQS
jgi:hypothetical protein